ncbi:hypothetical protein LCGC14_1106600 [marine sediment metagenome]|uniref:Uncharacterized protein n=1 Tax=marine sediment metagenome TaxID=412755 RepID=A0A0F9PR51_9ZZZZ
MSKYLLLLSIAALLIFFPVACGENKVTLKVTQCKGDAATEKDCMKTVITVDTEGSVLPF